MVRQRLRQAILFCVISAIAALPAAAQTPSAPYVVISGTNVPVGDGTKGSHPMPTTGGGSSTVVPVGSAGTDVGGAVGTGGTYQTVQASTPARLNCIVQNNDATHNEPLLVKFGSETQPIAVPYPMGVTALNGIVVNTAAITVTAATTGHTFAGQCQ